MAFSKAMPVAFCVTLFNDNLYNNESKEPHVFIGRVSIAQLLAKHLCVFIVLGE